MLRALIPRALARCTAVVQFRTHQRLTVAFRGHSVSNAFEYRICGGVLNGRFRYGNGPLALEMRGACVNGSVQRTVTPSGMPELDPIAPLASSTRAFGEVFEVGGRLRSIRSPQIQARNKEVTVAPRQEREEGKTTTAGKKLKVAVPPSSKKIADSLKLSKGV